MKAIENCKKEKSASSKRKNQSVNKGIIQLKELDIYPEQTWIVVKKGEEKEWLRYFFQSLGVITSKCYVVKSKKKKVIDVLVNRALKEAVFTLVEEVYIDLRKLVFTNGKGFSRKLKYLRMKNDLKVSMQWKAFKSDIDDGKKKVLIVCAYNPLLHEGCVYETEVKPDCYEVLISMPKRWESNRIHFWAFWYEFTEEGVVDFSTNQHVGEITLLK